MFYNCVTFLFKYNLALHLVDTDLDPPKWTDPNWIQIRIHNMSSSQTFSSRWMFCFSTFILPNLSLLDPYPCRTVLPDRHLWHGVQHRSNFLRNFYTSTGTRYLCKTYKLHPRCFGLVVFNEFVVLCLALFIGCIRIGYLTGIRILQTSVGVPRHFGADPDPRICTSDKWIWIQLRIRLLSSVTLRMQEKKFFSIFFYTSPAGTLSSVLNFFYFFLKFCVKILVCKHYFSPLNTFMRKGRIWIRSRIRIHTSD